MDAGGADILCRGLELERKVLDFYIDAQARCSNEFCSNVFSLLAQDKLRLITRLAEVHAAVCQGMSMKNACSLADDDLQDPAGLPADAGLEPKAPPSAGREAELLDLALREQRSCLDFFENELRRVKDPDARSFLGQALKDEQEHLVLLSDMHRRYEQAVELSNAS
ncbi:hypothetical protein [Fundidesulfovibrio terrae]|uniref:hypothetical protein n=1 Tax=Fundidesulfovibrio terrae TaxID=2922866 RepID=UPI001FAED59A|nr:hypothetical protein [Fundidesulfovibrio terrae]